MAKIRKILVPTDFSDSSKLAVRYAAEVAKAMEAQILLAHVTEAPFDYEAYGLGPETVSRIRQDLRKTIDEQLDAIRVEYGCGDDCTLHVREGTPSLELVDLAKREGVDMIVIATRGESGIKHLVLGSTTERVVRMAECPVLTVRDDQRPFTTPS